MTRVQPGVLLVRARFFFRVMVLMREDLPTLDLPAKAISGRFPSGYCEGSVADLMNCADSIFMALFQPGSQFVQHFESAISSVKVKSDAVFFQLSFKSRPRDTKYFTYLSLRFVAAFLDDFPYIFLFNLIKCQ